MARHGERPTRYVEQIVYAQDSEKPNNSRVIVDEIRITNSDDDVICLARNTSKVSIEIKIGEEYYVSIKNDGETMAKDVFIYGDDMDDTIRSFDLSM